MNSIEELDFSKTYTYADYYSWRFEERVELIKGKVFEMGGAPGANHQLILGNIASELYQFLKGKPTTVMMAPFDIRLVKDEIADEDVRTVVQPDISIICDRTKLADDRSCLGSPDIIVEILIAGNNQKEIRIKHELYEEYGVKEYWVVFSVSQVLVRYVLNQESRFEASGRPLTFGDILTTPILPSFELAMDEVFRDLL